MRDSAKGKRELYRSRPRMFHQLCLVSLPILRLVSTHVPDVGEFLDHLTSQPHGPSDGFDLDPNRNREMEPIESSEEELDQQVNVLGFRVRVTAIHRLVGKGDLEVVIIPSLVLVHRLARRVLALGVLVPLVDPVLLGVPRGTLFIGQSSDGEDPQGVGSLTHIADPHGVYKAGERLLHDILDHVRDGDEQARIDQAPEELDQVVEPFHRFRSRRGINLPPLSVHVEPDGIHLGLQPPSNKADERDQDSTDGGTDETVLDEPPESVSKRRKDPDQGHTYGTGDTEELDLVLDIVELGGTRRREGVQEDVGALVRRSGGVKVLRIGVFDDDLATGSRVPHLETKKRMRSVRVS